MNTHTMRLAVFGITGLIASACQAPTDVVYDNPRDADYNTGNYVPESPSNLTATSNDAGTVISLIWEDNSGAETGFKIERSIGSAAFQEIAQVGSDLTSWQDELTSKGTNPRTYRVSALYDSRASDPSTSNVVVFTYSFEVTVNGNGRVDQQVVQSKSADYSYGTVIQLTAVAEQGWVFTGWSGAASGTSNTIQVTVDKATTVTAVFERLEYPLTVNVQGEGSVTERVVQTKTTNYEYETIVELTATTEQGWVFTSWSGDLTGTQNPAQIEINESKNVIAIFERRDYPLTVEVEGEGTVTERVVQAKTTNYEYETVVELSATAAQGWVFTGWTGDLSGTQNPAQIEINGPKNASAVFERQQYPLTIDIEGEGIVDERMVQVKSTDYAYKAVVELTAVARQGWIFMGWNGDLSGSKNPVQIEMNDSKSVTAIFVPAPIDIDGNEYITVTIGEQIWMAENLRVTRYRDGGSILNITKDSQWVNIFFGAWSHYNNDEYNNDIYGKLYNWYAVNDNRGLCPEGWYVPTDTDWAKLSVYLGGLSIAGGKMKGTGTEFWKDPNTGATNESGFNALPAGSRFSRNGFYDRIEYSAYFWSSSEFNTTDAWTRSLNHYEPTVSRGYGNKGNGFSVRCIADLPS